MHPQEADEGLGYQLCNRCWPDAPASMAHYTHNDYDIDGQGIIWSGWPDAPGRFNAHSRATLGQPAWVQHSLSVKGRPAGCIGDIDADAAIAMHAATAAASEPLLARPALQSLRRTSRRCPSGGTIQTSTTTSEAACLAGRRLSFAIECAAPAVYCSERLTILHASTCFCSAWLPGAGVFC